MLADGSWDLRVPAGLVQLFPWSVRRGYWYKVTRVQARAVVALLADAYGVAPPLVDETQPAHNGQYVYSTRTISVWPRGHLKTVFHEFYHHLDGETGGRYCSSDAKRLAWQYADRMWDALKAATPRTAG